MSVRTAFVRDFNITGVIVCVEYDDYLRITLPLNRQWFSRLCIVTSPDDKRTQELVAEMQDESSPGFCTVSMHVTDAFYRNGDRFNKGRAIEEAFSLYDHRGWFLHLDADVILPSCNRQLTLDTDKLHGAKRRMLETVPPSLDFDWNTLPLDPHKTIIGYFQLFHSSASSITRKPWYPTNCPTAAVSDLRFAEKWPFHIRRWLNLEVLHLGLNKENWSGRCTPRLDGAPIPDAAERAADHYRRHPSFKVKKCPPR